MINQEQRYILKRDGRTETWSTDYIAKAIFKAFKASGIKDSIITKRLAKKVEDKVFEDGKTIAEQEFVQNCVESILMKNGFEDIARRYIIYREQRRVIREIDLSYNVDSKGVIESYIDASDWRVNENASVNHSLGGLILHMQGEMQKRYVLNKVYPKEIREAHQHGYFHLHDLTFGMTGYCSGFSLRDLLLEGFNNKYAENSCASGPSKHFDAVLGQMVNFLGTLQNEWAGAMAFNQVDTYLAPFIRYDKLSYNQVKQDLQKFIFNINTTSRWGSQAPFVNLTFDVTCQKLMENEPVIIGGKYQESTYKEYQEEMNMINKAFTEIMTEGDYDGKLHSYPIPTYNVTSLSFFDGEIGEAILKMTAKYGIPYFQNFINSDLNPEDIRSMCPLHPDENVIVKINDIVYNKTMLECWTDKDTNSYKIYHKGNWYDATMTSTKSIGCVKITLKNGSSTIMDLRHEQRIKNTYDGPTLSVKGSDIIVGDWLPTSLITLNGETFFNRFNPEQEIWDQVDTIELVEYTGDVYCFVVNSTDHEFTLSNGIITHNCRLQMDLRELKKKTGGLFGASDLTGSVGVCTLNLGKLAYLSQNKEEFLELLTEYATLAKESLEIKRKYIQEQFNMGFMPWTKRYLKNGYKTYFSTIGLVGGHEACMNLLHKGIETEEGTELMIDTLNHLRDLTMQFQEETGNLYNLEATPAESTSYRLAKIDRDLYGNSIYLSGSEDVPYYTNSTNLPVDYTDDVLEALEHQNKLQPLYTGGTVFHSLLGEAISDTESLKNYLIKVMTLTKIPYVSITPTFSVCHEHGYLNGEQFTCPECGKETKVYTRIVGYYRPLSSFNKGKKQEYKERKTYNLDNVLNAAVEEKVE